MQRFVNKDYVFLWTTPSCWHSNTDMRDSLIRKRVFGSAHIFDFFHTGFNTFVCKTWMSAIYFYVTDGNIMYLSDASRFLISCVIQHYAPVVGCGGVEEQMHNVDYDPGPWRQTLS